MVVYEASATVAGQELETLLLATGAAFPNDEPGADDDDGPDDDGSDDDDGDDQGDDELAVALGDLPAQVLAAADGALPGAVWTSAVVETEDGVQVYELQGTLGGAVFEVEIAVDGTVLELQGR